MSPGGDFSGGRYCHNTPETRPCLPCTGRCTHLYCCRTFFSKKNYEKHKMVNMQKLFAMVNYMWCYLIFIALQTW